MGSPSMDVRLQTEWSRGHYQTQQHRGRGGWNLVCIIDVAVYHATLYMWAGLMPGVPSRNPRHVGRIGVLSFEPASAHEAVLVLQQLKRVVRGGRAAAMVTMPTGLVGNDCDALVRRVADAVVCLKPLMDDDPLLELLAEPQTCVLGVHVGTRCRPPPQLLRADARW